MCRIKTIGSSTFFVYPARSPSLVAFFLQNMTGRRTLLLRDSAKCYVSRYRYFYCIPYVFLEPILTKHAAQVPSEFCVF